MASLAVSDMSDIRKSLGHIEQTLSAQNESIISIKKDVETLTQIISGPPVDDSLIVKLAKISTGNEGNAKVAVERWKTTGIVISAGAAVFSAVVTAILSVLTMTH